MGEGCSVYLSDKHGDLGWTLRIHHLSFISVTMIKPVSKSKWKRSRLFGLHFEVTVHHWAKLWKKTQDRMLKSGLLAVPHSTTSQQEISHKVQQEPWKDTACWLVPCSKVHTELSFLLAQGMVLPTAGWILLHNQQSSYFLEDRSTGHSTVENPSTETSFSGDSRVCQVDSQS